MQKVSLEQNRAWEAPEIDLNLRHYSGSVCDVFKRIKKDIVNYLSSNKASEKSKQVYSAIYNALCYYEKLSPEFEHENTFLSSSIKIFNEDFEYLSKKYASNNLLDTPVISLSARIKSPLSFVEKVKDKVDEYIEENRNFIYFNESLRDIIGVRIVVNPPSCIKKIGFQAESDYLYDVFYDLMTHRGILDGESYPTTGKFRFLDVNTRYDPHKLEKMKSVKYPGKFITTSRMSSKNILNELDNYSCIIKPETRPDYMEKIDSKVKDYHFYPKTSGYQSLHICVIPFNIANYLSETLPECIIPPTSSNCTIEYQFRTLREDDFSSHGPASHSTFKPLEKVYHRLAIPFFIDSDSLNSLKISQSLSSVSAYSHVLKPRNFGENYQRFYGPSFEDRFNIDYEVFSSTFDEKTKDEILAGKKVVIFDEKTHSYSTEVAQTPIFVEKSDKTLLDASLIRFLDDAHISDSSILPTSQDNNQEKVKNRKNNIKIYKVISHSKVIGQKTPHSSNRYDTSPKGKKLFLRRNFPRERDE